MPAVGTDQPATISAPQPKPAKKEKEKKDIFDRIGERLIAQQQQIDITKPAKFGPLEPQIAPRDPSAFGEEGIEFDNAWGPKNYLMPSILRTNLLFNMTLASRGKPTLNNILYKKEHN